jgi:membrane-bound metal-dependent hydrolase YbcI (DUF457 family)
MLAGHFAVGLALKGHVPKAPMWALMLGAVLPDGILFGLALAGLVQITPAWGVPPGFAVTDLGWSHSLLTLSIWAVLYALLFLRRGRDVALAAGAAVFSHFPLDYLVIPGLLALWPGSSVHLGLGLWQTLPLGWWFVELAIVLMGSAYYVVRVRQQQTSLRGAFVASALVLVLHVGNFAFLRLTR